MLHRAFKLSLVLVLSFAVLTVSALAGDTPQRCGAFGIKGGLFGGGDVDFTSKTFSGLSGSFETDRSYSIGAFVERDVYRSLRAVLSVDIHNLKKVFLEADEFGDDLEKSEMLLDIALGLKTSIPFLEDRLAFRPSLLAGIAHLQAFDGFDGSRYMTVKAAGELVAYTPKGTGFLIEVGLFWAPSGGSDSHDITGGPMLLTRLGILM